MNEPVLRRKLVRPRSRPAADGERSALARALPRAMVRALSAGCGLTAQPGALSERPVALAEGLDRLGDEGFVALLSAADGGATGLLVLDPGLFAAVIEAMTLGRLAPGAPATPRRPTATDAALLGAVIDRLLAEWDRGLVEGGGAAAGWRMARAVTDQRLLGAILDEGSFRLADLALTLSAPGPGGGATRTGQMTLMVPDPAAPARTQGTTAPLRAVGGAAEADPGAGVEAAVQGATVMLTAVLGRVAMPLEQALALAVGQRLELPISALEEVELVGLDGRAYAAARLGQTRGMRAVRVTTLADGTAARPGTASAAPFSEAGAAPLQRLAAAG